jgi:tetratricopeptide (TPR) repeat protein
MILNCSMKELASIMRSSPSNICRQICRQHIELTSWKYLCIVLAILSNTVIGNVLPTYAQEETPRQPPQELIEQLDALQAAGEWDEAFIMVDKLLQEYPDWAEGHLKKCSMYGTFAANILTNEDEISEAYDTAASACTQAINSGRLSPDDLYNAHYMRGQIFYMLGHYDQALLDLNEAQIYSPKNGSVYWWRSYTYMAMDNPQAALEDAYKWIEYGPNREAAILFVISAVSRFGSETQIQAATTVIERAPDKMYTGYLWRCSLYAIYGPAGNAIKDCTIAIELEGKYLAPYYYRAVDEYNAGDLNEAAADLEIALERIPQYTAPSYYDIYDFLGGVYWGMQDYVRAEAMFTQAILYAPSPESQAREHLYRAVMRFVLDEKEAIIEDLDAVLATGSTDTELLQTLAFLYMQMDDLNAAIEAVNHAIEIAPDEGTSWMIRALAHYLNKQDDQAIEDLRKGAEILGFHDIQPVIDFIQSMNLHGLIGNLFRTVWNSDILRDELVSSLLEKLNPADRKLMENLLGH